MVNYEQGEGNRIIAEFRDGGFVSMDKRVFEQKTMSLLSCQTAKEGYDLAVSSTNYLKEHYRTDNIVRPIKW